MAESLLCFTRVFQGIKETSANNRTVISKRINLRSSRERNLITVLYAMYRRSYILHTVIFALLFFIFRVFLCNEDIYATLQNPFNAQIREDEICVDIVSLAEIGDYLWYHILNDKQIYAEDDEKVHRKNLRNCEIFYRKQKDSGNLITSRCKSVVLITRGSKEENKSVFKLLDSAEAKLKIFIIIHQGNADWLLPYAKSNGGPICALFATNNDLHVDNKELFPWPLGVSTFQKFPLVTMEDVDILSQRPYSCSFLVQLNEPSEENILRILKFKDGKYNCYIRNESRDPAWTLTVGEKIQILSDSDLTISLLPYHIYEALSLGSVPVVRETANSTDLQFLKTYKAPLISVTSWDELNRLLEKELNTSLQEKIARRAVVLNWYKEFRIQMAKTLLDVLNASFNKYTI